MRHMDEANGAIRRRGHVERQIEGLIADIIPRVV
jgi:hypothetical protein